MSDQALDLEALNGMFRDLVPHNRALNLSLEALDLEQASAVLKLPWSEALVGNPESRVLHGGAVTTLVDAACGAAVYAKLKEPLPIATLDLRLDFLRPPLPDRDVFCRAECFRATHNVAFVRAAAYHDTPDDAFATAAGTFMLSTPGKSVLAKE